MPSEPDRPADAPAAETIPTTPTAEAARVATRGARMSLASIGILLVAVALAATGQLILKNGMNLAKQHSQEQGRSLVLVAATSPWILGGLVVFAVSAVAWLVTLSRVPLSIAYPFNALGYVVILVASSVILDERTNVWTWLGTVVVIGGLIVVVTTAPTG